MGRHDITGTNIMETHKKQLALIDIREMAKSNFKDWIMYVHNGSDLIREEGLSTLVDAWDLHCDDMMMYDDAIFTLQDDDVFIKQLKECDTETINKLCEFRIKNVKYAWLKGEKMAEVDLIELANLIETEFNTIFYNMFIYPENWGHTQFWDICFPGCDLELIKD